MGGKYIYMIFSISFLIIDYYLFWSSQGLYTFSGTLGFIIVNCVYSTKLVPLQ